MFGNLLFDCMGDIVIDTIGANEGLSNINFLFLFHITIILIFIFGVSLLEKYLCSKFFEELVGLWEEFIDFCVFGLFELI